jgi:hypothetical protein
MEHNLCPPLRNTDLGIQATSIIVGQLFSRSYFDRGAESDVTLHLLEAYKELRRALPIVGEDENGNNLHKGYSQAWHSTQEAKNFVRQNNSNNKLAKKIEDLAYTL